MEGSLMHGFLRHGSRTGGPSSTRCRFVVRHPPGTPLALVFRERFAFLGSEASMTPEYTGRIAELERLTTLLAQQRDRMVHAEDRQFAEILLQSAMAKVCALKTQSAAPAPTPRAA
jgi:hypothetical protein